MDSYYYRQVRFGPGNISQAVKYLIIANVAVFLLQSILWRFFPEIPINSILGMRPESFIGHFFIWQPVTYMFLHGGLFHILFNMLFLWMFGTEVEERMGTRDFTIFYFFCGIGAGILTCVIPANWHIPTMGASGAIYGIFVAFGLMFPNRMILLFFMIPVKAYYLMMGLVALQIYSLVFSPGGNISYIAHVGGAGLGYLFLRYHSRVSKMIDNYVDNKEQRKEQQGREETLNEQKKTDEILDKINKEGMHKLTRAERKFLRDRSRRKRNK